MFLNNDQKQLERLYNNIVKPTTNLTIKEISCLEEGIWKKIAPLATAAAMGASAFAADKDPAALYNVTKNDVVYAKNLASYQDNMYNMDINNIKQSIKRSFGTLTDNKVSQLIIEVSERVNEKGNYRDVVVTVSGDVLANSQEEANNIAARTIKDAIIDSGINMDGLKIVVENINKLKKFSFLVRVILTPDQMH